MKMASDIFTEEEILKEVIFPDLDKGRKDWDRPHTEAVVYWMKRILGKEKSLNKKVLITAAYAHDWGYAGLFVNRESYDSIQKRKADHMRVGARKIKKLLEGRLKDKYSKQQIKRIVHLVAVHDKLDKVEGNEEIALVEADTLGGLDISKVRPTFSRKDNDRYLVEVKRRRRPLFMHKSAIEFYDKLVEKRAGYFDV